MGWRFCMRVEQITTQSRRSLTRDPFLNDPRRPSTSEPDRRSSFFLALLHSTSSRGDTLWPALDKPLFIVVPDAITTSKLTNLDMSTNATSSDGSGMVGWISPNARRNTWDIIVSCLSIFLVCSWKCVHLNPPTAEEARCEWHTLPKDGKGKWVIPIFPKAPLRRKWARRLRWMGIISIAPELGVAVSVQQWLAARRLSKKMGEPCTVSHAFLFEMGGVILREVTEESSVEAPKRPAAEGGDLERTASETVAPTNGQADYLAEIGDLGLPGLLAIPTVDEITDRSKSDAFTKLFALVQSGWLIMSSIARVHNGYAITELELATMAFIVCAFVMYFFWWNKPFGIEQRWIVVRTTKPGNESVRTRGRAVYPEDQRTPDLDWDSFVNLVLNEDLFFKGKLAESYPALALYLSGMAFSAVHVAAWNWEFPSRLIQILWRTSTVAAFGASFFPFIVAFISYLGDRASTDWIGAMMYFLGVGVTMGAVFIYVVARLFIVFLTFYCFSAMPASAYEKVEWTGYIPHFS
ncbi:hypothetical protein B0T18DRAFT_6400 [Schizothecium vesticola]|uniref:Uncharacterized protein n=1 Tax=Schizothecium vesticola TaxID=314040 RepID=A0AA40F8L0_9PEZI|nr:hypothetical protein B0T18DRAFT_6400 [Schizothecium vesticola]